MSGGHLRIRHPPNLLTSIQRFPKTYKRLMPTPWFPQPLCSSPRFFSYLYNLRSGAVVICSSLATLSIIMFSKAVLTVLDIGAVSVNTLVIPIAQSPAPDSESEFPRSSIILRPILSRPKLFSFDSLGSRLGSRPCSSLVEARA